MHSVRRSAVVCRVFDSDVSNDIFVLKDIIGSLRTHGLLEADIAQGVVDAYYCYLEADHQAKLAELPSRVSGPTFASPRECVSALWEHMFE